MHKISVTAVVSTQVISKLSFIKSFKKENTILLEVLIYAQIIANYWITIVFTIILNSSVYPTKNPLNPLLQFKTNKSS